MSNKILRKIFLAFMRIHILYHAEKEPFFGLWMKEELESHGYSISSGTLYPILHDLEEDGILKSTERVVAGKVRKYYSLTDRGEEILEDVKRQTMELFAEIFETREGDG
ncbi:MAG: PadR family transcriptional regulator [Halanaerobiaceae bacterium]